MKMKDCDVPGRSKRSRWIVETAYVVDEVGKGSLMAGDEGATEVFGEAPLEYNLRILAKVRYQACLTRSLVTANVIVIG